MKCGSAMKASIPANSILPIRNISPLITVSTAISISWCLVIKKTFSFCLLDWYFSRVQISIGGF